MQLSDLSALDDGRVCSKLVRFSAAVFLEAAELFRSARRQGLPVRSSVDCVIAACALRHDLEVLHRDRDYAHLAQVSGLRQRRV